jgi:hypothetical protein
VIGVEGLPVSAAPSFPVLSFAVPSFALPATVAASSEVRGRKRERSDNAGRSSRK